MLCISWGVRTTPTTSLKHLRHCPPPWYLRGQEGASYLGRALEGGHLSAHLGLQARALLSGPEGSTHALTHADGLPERQVAAWAAARRVWAAARDGRFSLPRRQLRCSGSSSTHRSQLSPTQRVVSPSGRIEPRITSKRAG